MTVANTLVALGGVATTAELTPHHTKRQLRESIDRGEIARAARGRYALASTDAHRASAHARSAVLSYLSAALAHGWKVKTVPDRAHLTLPRQRRLRGGRDGIVPHWGELNSAERAAGMTSPVRTVLDCARVLPFDEALTVADSALRSGRVGRLELTSAAASRTGAGRATAMRVAAHADSRSAGPIESVLRAITIEESFDLTPQVELAEPGMYAVADLASKELRLVVEAEGYQSHGTRAGLRRDCRRRSGYAVHGWSVLRFSYEERHV